MSSRNKTQGKTRILLRHTDECPEGRPNVGVFLYPGPRDRPRRRSPTTSHQGRAPTPAFPPTDGLSTLLDSMAQSEGVAALGPSRFHLGRPPCLGSQPSSLDVDVVMVDVDIVEIGVGEEEAEAEQARNRCTRCGCGALCIEPPYL